jgi:hypothetical protein
VLIVFLQFAMKANFPPDHYPADTFGGPVSDICLVESSTWR